MSTRVSTVKYTSFLAEDATVTVTCSPGIGIHSTGLRDECTKESLLRVITALTHLGYKIPGKKIVIEISPSESSEWTSLYDLPIAVAILAETGQETLSSLSKHILLGELGLDGTLRSTIEPLSIVDLIKCWRKDVSFVAPKGEFLVPIHFVKEAKDLRQVLSILS